MASSDCSLRNRSTCGSGQAGPSRKLQAKLKKQKPCFHGLNRSLGSMPLIAGSKLYVIS